MPQGPSNERGLLEAAERDRGKKEKKRRSSSVCSPSSEKIEGEPRSFFSLSLSLSLFFFLLSRNHACLSIIPSYLCDLSFRTDSWIETESLSSFVLPFLPIYIYIYNIISKFHREFDRSQFQGIVF